MENNFEIGGRGGHSSAQAKMIGQDCKGKDKSRTGKARGRNDETIKYRLRDDN